MNVFMKDGVRIDFNQKMNRFSITKDKEFLSISPTVFMLLVTLADSESDYERISIQQNGSLVEIIKLVNNYLLTFTCKSLSSSLILPGHILVLIAANYTNMIGLIKFEKNTQKRQNITHQAKIIVPRRKRTHQEDNTSRGKGLQDISKPLESFALPEPINECLSRRKRSHQEDNTSRGKVLQDISNTLESFALPELQGESSSLGEDVCG